MAEIGTDAGLARDETALAGASKLSLFLWAQAWQNADKTLAGDEGALHDFRVALRRLRTALQNFEGDKNQPLLSASLRRELRDWRGEIGKLGDKIGRVRDFDVLGDYARDAPQSDSPALRKFAQVLSDERAKNFAPMTRKLERANEENGLRERFARFALGLPAALSASQTTLGDAAKIILPARLKETLALGSALQSGDDEAQHELRRSLRRVRYSLETLAPCFDRPIKKPVKKLVELQDLLGEMQDRVVLEQWLVHSFKHPPEEVEAFVEQGEKRRAELLEQVRELWRKREAAGLWNELRLLT